LSSAEKLTASPCVPSRNVVSNVNTRITGPWRLAPGRLSSRRYARLLFLLQERHHLPQFRADLLDGLILLGFPNRQELLAAGLVLVHPFTSELPRLDLLQDLLHLRASLIVHHARTARVIAVLCRVRYRVPHVAETALVNQIDNQLHFM